MFQVMTQIYFATVMPFTPVFVEVNELEANVTERLWNQRTATTWLIQVQFGNWS